MRSGRACLVALVVLLLGWTRPFHAAGQVAYRLTFPEPQHHWMQVEATFSGLEPDPLELRMSRASPGRYSLHDFAKNVYDVEAHDESGSLELTRPDPYGWKVARHAAAVTVRYKVFGDRIDGTYLAIDPTHAHINMPAAIMWARGFDEAAISVTFEPPRGAEWQVATQLHPGATAHEFTAPNLQYLMDSPSEFGPIAIRQFTIDGHAIRFAVHHTGTSRELDSFVKDVEKVVRQEERVFGELPSYEPGNYTFIADYLPYAYGDGMEHRNSTVITSSRSLREDRDDLLDTVAHEFFHGWNVERIRPRSLEPFDFERANMSGELWLAEGFTQYYGPLSLGRAGLADLRATAEAFNEMISAITVSPGRDYRSAEAMSQMAAFTDGGRTNDPTNWNSTVISYYPFGGAIALALDLTLRDRTGGRVTLDDFMRAMWRIHGKPGGAREGYVDHPYTIDDAEARLAEASGDRAFAHDFFARYIHGREIADYDRLLRLAGLIIRKENPGQAWFGDLHFEHRSGGVRIGIRPPSNVPLYAAGLDVDDELRQVDGSRVGSVDDVTGILKRHKPGERVAIVYVDRSGVEKKTAVTLGEDPRIEIVPIESTGSAATAVQRAFRAAWLGAN
jgi:predicted metalloprotease with PDZ domain